MARPRRRGPVPAAPIHTEASSRSLALALLGVVLVVGALGRIWVAWFDDGIYWPDEIYQSLEPAHRLVFGYGLIAWEFVEGARNWTLPGLIACWLKLCDVLNVAEPRVYLTGIRLAFVACSLGCSAGAYLLARAYGARAWSAAVAAALSALFAPAIYFSTRALSEGAAALPVILGFALALAPDAGRRRLIAGSSLVGFSVLLRLPCAAFGAGLVIVLLCRREFRRALTAGATLAAWALVFGLMDRLTWAHVAGAHFGGWFQSAAKYIEFNIIQGRSSEFGTSPWHYFFTTLFHDAPILVTL